MRSRTRLVAFIGILAAVWVGTTTAPALAHRSDASGSICGTGRCLAIPHSLAVTLSQRGDLFRPVSVPRPSAYYRITIRGTGDGYIDATIFWVPSRHALYMKEHVEPDNPGYWRSEGAVTRTALASIVGKLKPFAAPRRWAVPR